MWGYPLGGFSLLNLSYASCPFYREAKEAYIRVGEHKKILQFIFKSNLNHKKQQKFQKYDGKETKLCNQVTDISVSFPSLKNSYRAKVK